MTFGKDLKKFREERKLSRKDVAQALNISYSTLTDYENDNIDIPLSKAMKLFNFYRIIHHCQNSSKNLSMHSFFR